MKQFKTMGYSALLILFLCLNPTNGFLERNTRQINRNFFGNIWQPSYEMLDARKDTYRNFKLLSEQNKEFRDQIRNLQTKFVKSETRRDVFVESLPENQDFRDNSKMSRRHQLTTRYYTDRESIYHQPTRVNRYQSKNRRFSQDSSERKETGQILNTRNEDTIQNRRDNRNFIDSIRVAENRRFLLGIQRIPQVLPERQFQARDFTDRARIIENRLHTEIRANSIQTRRVARDIGRVSDETRQNLNIRNDGNTQTRREIRDVIDKARSVENRFTQLEVRRNSQETRRVVGDTARILLEKRETRNNKNDNTQTRREVRDFTDRVRIVENRRFQPEDIRVNSQKTSRFARELTRVLTENRESRQDLNFGGNNIQTRREDRDFTDRARRSFQPEIRFKPQETLRFSRESVRDSSERRESRDNLNIIETRDFTDRTRIVDNVRLQRENRAKSQEISRVHQNSARLSARRSDSRQDLNNSRRVARDFIDRAARSVEIRRFQLETRRNSQKIQRVARESSRVSAERRESRQNSNSRRQINSESRLEGRDFTDRIRSFNSESGADSRTEIRESRWFERRDLGRNVRLHAKPARISIKDSRTRFVAEEVDDENREIRILDRRLTQEKDRQLSDPTRRISHLSSKDENNNNNNVVVFTRQSIEGRRLATSFDTDSINIPGQKSSALFNTLQLVLLSVFIAQIVGNSKTKRNWVHDFVTITKQKVL